MFQFTIRDVLWLMVVVAIMCALSLNLIVLKQELHLAQRAHDRIQAELRREIEALRTERNAHLAGFAAEPNP